MLTQVEKQCASAIVGNCHFRIPLSQRNSEVQIRVSIGSNLRERAHFDEIQQIRFNLTICNRMAKCCSSDGIRMSTSLNQRERAYLDGIQKIRFTLATYNHKWQITAFWIKYMCLMAQICGNVHILTKYPANSL